MGAAASEGFQAVVEAGNLGAFKVGLGFRVWGLGSTIDRTYSKAPSMPGMSPLILVLDRDHNRGTIIPVD